MTTNEDAQQQFDHRQNLSLLKVYTAYRVVVCLVILVAFLTQSIEDVVFGNAKPTAFIYSITAYLLLNVLTLVLILPKSRQLNNQQLFINFFLDIVAIVLLVDASGGVRSGLELLLIVAVAASSIMLPFQIALLLAALASIGILVDTISLVNEGITDVSSFVSAGLVGMVLFLTAFFIQNLAARIRGSQLLAAQRAIDVSKLQQLNQQIVQRMRTGILVCDKSGTVVLSNSAASELLGDERLAATSERGITSLPEPLATPLSLWRDSPDFRSPPIFIENSDRELLVSFSAISENSQADTLIFLEDNRRLVKHAQQMKLASLGRLTASIAHEIRNPLGAISHASQLLAESDQLPAADRRLCDIINNHSDRMNKVIENILHLSSRSAANPVRLSLRDWLRQFIDEFENEVQLRGSIEFLSDDQPHETHIDSSQLNQVVTNISQNGLRYSEMHTGKASVLFKLYDHPVTHLPILDIIDFGPGVEKEAVQHLFEPFYTTDPKGSGLGLYISRELCEANEARLDYILTEQNQSCFRISFPHPDRKPSPE